MKMPTNQINQVIMNAMVSIVKQMIKTCAQIKELRVKELNYGEDEVITFHYFQT